MPSIRWRQGEYGALEELRSDQRELITPLVDIPPIPWDFVDEQPSRTLDQHLSKVPSQMARAWGSSGPIFLDLGLVGYTLRMADGRHPVDDLFERLSLLGIEAIPVTATDRDAEYQNAVRSVITRDGRGVCIRVSVDDLADPASMGGIGEIARNLTDELGQVDLVIDFGAIEPAQIALLQTIVTSTVRNLPNLETYRTLTLLSGAFPVNLTGVPQGLTLLPRADWALWLSIRSRVFPRKPALATIPQRIQIRKRLTPGSCEPARASVMPLKATG